MNNNKFTLIKRDYYFVNGEFFNSLQELKNAKQRIRDSFLDTLKDQNFGFTTQCVFFKALTEHVSVIALEVEYKHSKALFFLICATSKQRAEWFITQKCFKDFLKANGYEKQKKGVKQ
ncbi:hypothetical protein [Helicobacter cetorum]|uniref:Uncharacterized protein n=2 Tax=Helicobacter cetorum TaxID=138563 RepID=I0EPL8_HELC0|nr:hypothetical protein [Helicobacter cetorum]ABS86821.1 hypothetical protein pz24w [Helicobacter cetorum]AFI04887.1 hypothetical protein HCW_08150 [Helicobacter cetorum MIT 00-7128]